MVKHLLQLLIWGVIFLLAPSAGAGTPSLCPDRPIRFAHYEFGFIYSSGYGGIDDELQKELLRRSGCRFEVILQPRARTWFELENGRVDMAGSGIETPHRSTFAWFFPYIVEDNVVVLGDKIPKNMHSFDAFVAHPKLTLGGVRAYRYSPYYDKFVDQLIAAKRHQESPDPGGLYRMFAFKRFDAFITNPILYLFYVKQMKLPAPTRIEDWDPAGPTPSCLVLSKKSFTEVQAKQWQTLLNEMLADGTVERITVKFLGKTMGSKTVYRGAKN